MLSQILISYKRRNEPATQTTFDTSVTQHRVWPHLIDYNLHMNNAKYLTVLEATRWGLFRDLAWFKKMMSAKLNIVIGSMEITFIRELPLLAKYDVHTRIMTWDEKYLYFEQKIFVKGKLHGHALFKFAGVRKGKRVMMPEMCEILGVNYEDAQPYAELEHWSAMSQAKRETASE